MTAPLVARDDGWFTLGQAAKYLGISESTLRKWTDEGRIQAFSTPGGHRRFRGSDLDEFLSNARVVTEGRPPLVLVVDDNDDRRTVVRFSLEAEGYAVREAATASEGLEALEEEAPDLVLLDILMPDMDGWEMLCKLRDTHGLDAMPVVMFAGADAGRHANPRPGTKRFVPRPDPLRLVESAKQLLGAHSAPTAAGKSS